MILFLPELLLTFAAGPLRISVHISAAAAEDYFLALGFLVQFISWHPIDDRDNFAATFGAFTGFAVYDDWFHNRI